jgi:hypothetical protein
MILLSWEEGSNERYQSIGMGSVMCERRHFEPLAKKIAVMFRFKVSVDGRYIPFCEDRSEGTRNLRNTVTYKILSKNTESYPADETWGSLSRVLPPGVTV